jgi:translation initiation factor 3 subunit L
VGFAYMMMRRYQDAIRTLANILLYVQRTKQMFHAALYDQVGNHNYNHNNIFVVILIIDIKGAYNPPF